MKSVATTLYDAYQRLQSTSDSPHLDAELLLAHCLGYSRTQLRLHMEQCLTVAECEAYDTLLERRYQREPIAYLTGNKEFWSLPLRITTDVLVPRSDTECLVEAVLAQLTATTAAIVDLGTGSGAIALALASERPAWRVVATDLSLAALEVARDNAQRLQLTRIEWRHGSWTEALLAGEYFDAIVSNPPYLSYDDPHLYDSEISHEPTQALVAADQGLAAYHNITAQSIAFLKPGGWLFFEHGATQDTILREILAQYGFENIQTLNDLSGLPRVSYGQARLATPALVG